MRPREPVDGVGIAGRSRASAFTLLEVLVSLAIFAIAAVVLGATYANVLIGYDRVARAQEHVEEGRLVRALVLGEPDRKLAEQGGDLPLPDHRTASWTATIQEAGVADLFSVTLRIEVRDPARAEPWVHDEKFMLLRPSWSDPTVRDKLRQGTHDRLEKAKKT